MARLTDRIESRFACLGALALSVMVSIVPSTSRAIDLPQNFNFDGILISSSTGQPMVGPVSIVFQIYDPANTCLVYEELHSSVALDSAGGFAVKIGSGARAAAAADGGLALKQIFQNNGQVRGVGAGCAAGYTPASGDGRNLRVTVNGTALTPEYALSPVPMATVAETLQGKQPTDFVAASGATSLTGPMTLSNQGEVRFGSTNANYVSFQAQPAMPSPTAYFWPFTDGSSGNCLTTNGAGGLTWASCVSIGTPAGGDLTGSYPNPVLSTTGVSAGTYPKVTVDNKGRVTAGMALTTADLLPVALTGDVTGGVTTTSVDKIRGVNVSATAPSDGQVLKYNLGMSRWEPSTSADLSSGGTITGALNVTGNLTASGATSLGSLTASGLIMANGGLTVSSGAIASANGSAASPAMKVGVAGYGLFNTGSALGFSTNSSEQMRITNTGNVGIGTASPSFPLHVGGSPSSAQMAQFEGPVSIRNNSSGAPTNLTLININGLSNSGTALELAGLNGGSSVRTAAKISGFLSTQTVGLEDGVFSLSTVSSGTLGEKMRIDSAGNVGIGNTAPAKLLHVGSPSVGTGLAVANFQNIDGTCTITPASSGSGIACSSDERLKENFKDVTGSFALDRILQLQAVTYNFKTSSADNRRTGYKAQEVQKVAPEFVRENEDGLLQVYYDAFIPWITEATKTLYSRITGVEAHQAVQDQKIDSQVRENAKLKVEAEKQKQENAALKQLTSDQQVKIEELENRLVRLEQAINPK
ncbi:MAG: tail fiber domain-containing protein [Deltaproteobacteria bacterium]|jgi:hypothetical protein|nr:tail fiber domain-containing protein [Deltaproteobacteria bacterium]